MNDSVRPIIGHCAECGSKILMGEEYARISDGRQVVRGRIGDPSNEITGVTRGYVVFRCGGCLREIGPLR